MLVLEVLEKSDTKVEDEILGGLQNCIFLLNNSQRYDVANCMLCLKRL